MEDGVAKSVVARVKAEIIRSDGGKISLLLYADEDVEVELRGLKYIQECFFLVFGMKLKVDVLPTQLIDSN